MPLYEFKCQECGAEFETLVTRAAEKGEVKCPKCSSGELEEQVSSFASNSGPDCAPSGGG